MIKTTLIALMSVGVLGTGATTLTPETMSPRNLELAAGSARITIGVDGIQTQAADKAEFAIALCTETGRVFTVRF